MSSANYPLRTSGIYRNLPTFDPSIKGLKALICGGTGISGFHALRALLDSPQRWSTIYVVSRSPLPDSMAQFLSDEQKQHIRYISADLTSNPDKIAATFKEAGVKPDYVFFYSYMNSKNGSAMHPNTAQELVEANVPLFDNFLQSLPKAGIQPKRILLQTGGKNYGVHIGRTPNPAHESDPQPTHLQPNFYYNQEHLLFTYCSQHPETSYNIIRPCGIVGSANKTWLNLFTSFAIYAAVQAEKREALEFGGGFESWQYPCTHSSARMTGYLSEWAVLEDKCKNEAFNASDGSPLSFERFFESLGRWYGVAEGVALPKADEERTFDATYRLAGGKDSPLGYGPPVKVERSFALHDWARQKENSDAWGRIRLKIAKGGKGRLDFDPFANEEEIAQNFQGDFCYLRFFLGLDKVRRFGFNGYVDSLETVFEMYKEMSQMGMLPAMKVDSALPEH